MVDLNKPRYDQSTYIGRVKHFFVITNPLNLFKSKRELEEAKQIITLYRSGANMSKYSEEELWAAKNAYDSAYHPDTGELMTLIGRMSFQVPGNMTITGCMLTFYKTTPAVVFWQWVNQTFNATVNYTNRSGDKPISPQILGTSYVMATVGAVSTAFTLNKLVVKFPPIVGRFVPLAAVIAANCINIPCMRMSELKDGIPITDENGQRLGASTAAAKSAIAQVVVSRNIMATPGMVIPPIIMNHLDMKGLFKRFTWLGAPLQISLVGLMLTFTTPLCCALFPQQSSISFNKLESALQESIKKQRKGNVPDRVYFNKGL